MGNLQTAKFSIQGMSCASCVARLEKALLGVGGVQVAPVNLASETVEITFQPSGFDKNNLLAAAETAGYPLQEITTTSDTVDTKSAELQHLSRMAWLAAILATPIVIIEMGGHIFPSMHHFVANNIGAHNSMLIQFILTTIILAVPGLPFFTKGIPALVKGHPEMNSLVALGTGAAYLFSIVAGFMPHLLPAGSVNIYFEPAAVIVVLILIGRLAEARAKGRTGQAIAQLTSLAPKTALVQNGTDFHEKPVAALQIGDVIRLLPGQSVAVDGVVQTGDSYIDESMISGEPVPLAKTTGDAVTGGTINGNGTLTYRATRVGADTVLAQVIRMVEQAQGAKLPIQALVDKVTAWFVPAVMIIAVVTVIMWLILGPDLAIGHALVAGVSVLIIACPCAMGLATPTSIIVGSGRAAQLGVLFRKGDALQSLQACDTVIFDKTGTLTMGQPVMSDFEAAQGMNRDELLAMVAAVEIGSEHPIGQAIVTAAKAEGLKLPTVDNFAAITGMGVQAEVAGRILHIGTQKLMAQENIDIAAVMPRLQTMAKTAKTPVIMAIDGQFAALIAVSDPIKPTSVATVATLHKMGKTVVMLSGDHQDTADAIAAQLGIDHAMGAQMPKDKVQAIKAMQDRGAKVAFVGDGINDAPALAAADVGVAVGRGSDIAIEAADVILMGGELATLLNALTISHRTMGNIRQNLGWAFGYNILLIPVAAGLFYASFGLLLSPMLAAGAMAASSVFVVSNALRLHWVKPHQVKGSTI